MLDCGHVLIPIPMPAFVRFPIPIVAQNGVILESIPIPESESSTTATNPYNEQLINYISTSHSKCWAFQTHITFVYGMSAHVTDTQ